MWDLWDCDIKCYIVIYVILHSWTWWIYMNSMWCCGTSFSLIYNTDFKLQISIKIYFGKGLEQTLDVRGVLPFSTIKFCLILYDGLNFFHSYFGWHLTSHVSEPAPMLGDPLSGTLIRHAKPKPPPFISGLPVFGDKCKSVQFCCEKNQSGKLRSGKG
jgi:hypothetical protein